MMALGLVSKALHKLADQLEQISRKASPGMTVPASAQLNYAGLVLKPGCLLTLGEQTQVPGSIRFDREHACISIGHRSFISGSLIAAQSIEIGDDVLIAWNVTIVDHNSHPIAFSQRQPDAVNWLAGHKDWTHVTISPVKICDKAWIGFNAIILKGITIGEGAIIGAGSVVTKDIPPWTIAAGNPARVIREISAHER